MQIRFFRGGDHIGHLQRCATDEVAVAAVESKYDVSDEMMGLEWLIALQAVIQNNFSFCRRHSAKLVLGDCANYFFLSDDLRLCVVLPDTTRLQALTKTLGVPSRLIVWGRRHRCDRLSLTQVLKLHSVHADVIKLC